MAKRPALLPQPGNPVWTVSCWATDVHAYRPEKLDSKKLGKASGHPGAHLTFKLTLKKTTKTYSERVWTKASGVPIGKKTLPGAMRGEP